jgi:hypothetical protein
MNLSSAEEGKEVLSRLEWYAARVVSSMCLLGSHVFSTYSRTVVAPSE